MRLEEDIVREAVRKLFYERHFTYTRAVEHDRFIGHEYACRKAANLVIDCCKRAQESKKG